MTGVNVENIISLFINRKIVFSTISKMLTTLIGYIFYFQ